MCKLLFLYNIYQKTCNGNVYKSEGLFFSSELFARVSSSHLNCFSFVFSINIAKFTQSEFALSTKDIQHVYKLYAELLTVPKRTSQYPVSEWIRNIARRDAFVKKVT